MVSKQKILDRGAEATISKSASTVLKKRIKKSYRHPTLDEKIRKLRTRKEAKLLEKASQIIPTPKLISSNEKTKEIQMQYLAGKKLSQHLSSLPNYKTICKQIGSSIAKLHNAGIIHGDLTTSNMILSSSGFTPNSLILSP
jgi:Kae1-associated kinase Bud32